MYKTIRRVITAHPVFPYVLQVLENARIWSSQVHSVTTLSGRSWFPNNAFLVCIRLKLISRRSYNVSKNEIRHKLLARAQRINGMFIRHTQQQYNSELRQCLHAWTCWNKQIHSMHPYSRVYGLVRLGRKRQCLGSEDASRRLVARRYATSVASFVAVSYVAGSNVRWLPR